MKSLYFAQQLQDLAHHRITPRSVVGTGYKDARAVAFEWLSNMLMDALLNEAQQRHETNNA